MSQESNAAVVVLAAGVGRRMKSNLPKVLHPAAGRPLLAHVLSAVAPLSPARIVVVTSPTGQELFSHALAPTGLDASVTYATQPTPRGTADAARAGLAALEGFAGAVLVVPGDAPLLRPRTLEELLRAHTQAGAAATLLTARMADPRGYGRVIRDPSGAVARVVEERDATSQERRVDEINTSVYVFDSHKLAAALDKVNDDNAQGELYLTDVVGILVSGGERVEAFEGETEECLGVNSRAQLADVARRLRRRACEHWLDEGVSIVDPEVTYIDATVTIGRDAVIHPFTYLEGSTSVGAGAEVGPHSRVVDSEIEAGARVTFSVVVDSHVGPEASVGPYASLRAGTRLERGARLGTFVEAKNSRIGEKSKANHLAYLGDATLGRNVNVGAGTITCNWDGERKNPTEIGDEAYISSDTMLVAPVKIGRRAATGAGAVVRDDVPDDALAVGVPARVIEGKGRRMRHARAADDDPSGSSAQ
ncbi:MAG TPA: bifunctional UDP-N-acetylglucosamine diphosphorylase/glucosamine-1-phosphate N-acetyltransferase GlmU [Actinomycetota bacterium]|nr:bifunctional UDP-N-acetylglucosamine diphosphorylase/glucosamine-1-phosphate N-acetyltransferase GlmU [Actinomycetota bacterium]